MSKLANIIIALRLRITTAGFAISTSVVTDERDGTPIVMIFEAGDGDKTILVSPVYQKSANLVADLRFRHDNDWLLEGLEYQRTLEEAIFTGAATDSPDSLDGLALKVEPVKSITSPETENKMTSVQVHVKITYRE